MTPNTFLPASSKCQCIICEWYYFKRFININPLAEIQSDASINMWNLRFRGAFSRLVSQ